MDRNTVVRRVALSALATTGIVALGAAPASAHVTITPSTTAAGATAVLHVEVPHGCDGSATTAIAIRTPPEVTDVSADDTPRWTVEQSADGLTYTTDEPLPDEASAEVEFSVRLPDDAGATLVFPIIQTCEEGEAAWTEVAEREDDHDALDRPAPLVVVTAAGPEATSGTPGTEASAAPGTEVPAATDAGASAAPETEEQDPWLFYGAIVLVVAGGLAGGAALLRRRHQ